MFQNDPTLINLNSIPDGMTINDLTHISKMARVIPMSIVDTIASSSTELKADTILEHLGDILALEMIDGKQYFRLKAMLHSSDFETAKMARNIVFKHFQQV
jgi:hypothetical protein